MTFLRPFEPFLTVPSPGQHGFCIDRGSESARGRQAVRPGSRGFQALVSHPRTPDSVMRGITNGMWAPLGQRAALLHREDFPFESETAMTRWSVVLGLDLARSPLQPILHTDRDVVEANVQHLRTAGVDPGGIGLFYRDEQQFVERLAEARGDSVPLVTLQEANGTQHRLWILTQQEETAIVHLISETRAAIVGDVAIYRAIQRVRDVPGFSPEVYPIVNCFNQRDFGVTLGSLGAVFALPRDFSVNGLIAELHETFEITEYNLAATPPPNSHKEFFDAVRTEGIAERAMGLLFRGVPTGFLLKLPENSKPPSSWQEVPKPALEYDAEWAQRAIVARALADPEARPVRITEPRAVPQAFTELEHAMAVILNPPPKRHLPELADQRWRLPAWALQIRPPIVRGLFLAPFQPATSSARAR